MKYEVILSIKSRVISSWRFKSIMQAVRYLHEVDLDIVDASLFRLSDFHEFNVYEILDLYYGGKK